jgi:hypothetical protein
MAATAAFQQTFDELRSMLKKYEKQAVLKEDSPSWYYLNEKNSPNPKRPMGFAAVRLGKAYVSFYLVPVYVFPELLDAVSPGLKKRMQGKSCFNFEAIEPAHLKELTRLTKNGFERFKKEGFL